MENLLSRPAEPKRSLTQNMDSRAYNYVGPKEIREAAIMQASGTRISSLAELRAWLATVETDRLVDGTYVATFTITLNCELLVAPRRSEHVACASGGPVLSAGEIYVGHNLVVVEITNQSTGFCPEPESWTSVATALNCIGLIHPGHFTTEVIFRLCPSCHERNVVKDSWYYCDLCDAKLTQHWNFARDANAREQ